MPKRVAPEPFRITANAEVTRMRLDDGSSLFCSSFSFHHSSFYSFTAP
jgi:hypothetical protein